MTILSILITLALGYAAFRSLVIAAAPLIAILALLYLATRL